jgi:propanol-preferring alcohol dehydrogenase
VIDLHGWINDYPGKSQHPIVGGHEGVGEIVAIGAHTMQCPVKIGDRVGIKFVVDTCLTCEMCRKGREQRMWFQLERRL